MSTKTDEARKSGVVHFRIGEDMGIRLMEIAQEHLICDNNPEKAITAITDSLIGCPADYALKILKGDIVLLVDTESQSIMPAERIPDVHDRIFPKIDVLDFMQKTERQIEKHSDGLVGAWNMLKHQISNNFNVFAVNYSYNDIFKFIAGNNEVILETLRDMEEYSQIESLVAVSKTFIEHSMKKLATIEWMSKTWNEYGDDSNTWVSYIALKENVTDCIDDVMYIMKQVMNVNFRLVAEEDNVQKYINAMKEIDNVLSEGIKPVDIFKNYSAGWLSPEGKYYALNGEIENMLHNQIADGLVEIGIVPKDEPSPDAWLEQQGWVKIHTDNINYGGCLNSQIGKPNVNMTEEQVHIIKEYINRCHNGVMRLGWKLQRISAAKFEMTATNNMPMLNKNYFKF